MEINHIETECLEGECVLLNAYINKNTRLWICTYAGTKFVPTLISLAQADRMQTLSTEHIPLMRTSEESALGMPQCDNKPLTLLEVLISRDRTCISLFSRQHLGFTKDSQASHLDVLVRRTPSVLTPRCEFPLIQVQDGSSRDLDSMRALESSR